MELVYLALFGLGWLVFLICSIGLLVVGLVAWVTKGNPVAPGVSRKAILERMRNWAVTGIFVGLGMVAFSFILDYIVTGSENVARHDAIFMQKK